MYFLQKVRMKTVGIRPGVKGLKVFGIYRTAGLEKSKKFLLCILKSQIFKKVYSIPHLLKAHHWY